MKRLSAVGRCRQKPAAKHAAFPLLALVLAVTLNGCGSATPTRSVSASGFLGDYSQLRPGAENSGDPLLMYANPKADCKKYTRILLEPVALWASPKDSAFAKLAPGERSKLLDQAGQILQQSAAQSGYGLAETPAVDVMRLRVALTEAKLPDGPAKAAAAQAQGNAPALFTGEVAFELEAVDAMTGERLYAAADKRGGDMDPRNAAWNDVKAALKAWGERGVQRLAHCRATGSFTLPPQAQHPGDKSERHMP
ncbi:MAG: DUF3313 domain-containing protein [Candidatus Methylumidiphilus sp.]